MLWCCGAISAPCSSIQESQQQKRSSVRGYRPVSAVYINRKSLNINTDLLSVSQSVSSNTKPQGSSFYLQMATALIATPLYCLRQLFKITLLSFVCRITVLIPDNLSIVLFWTFKELLQKRSSSLSNHSTSHGAPRWICLE